MSKTAHGPQIEYVRDVIAKLVYRRVQKEITITDVVVKTGWSPTTVRRFESGLSNPTFMQVVVYTHAIGGDWEKLVRLESIDA